MRVADKFNGESCFVIRSLSIVAGIIMALVAADGQAAIVQTFTSKTDFLAQVPIQNSNIVTFGPSGPGPVIDLNGFASNASAGAATITAGSGLLYGASTILSTEIDRAALVLTFAAPLHAIGLTAFISDELVAPVPGTLLFQIAGSGTTSLPLTSVVPQSFLGLVSDTDFSSLRIVVDNFDTDVTSVAFSTLTDAVYMDLAPPSVLPAPGLFVLLLPAVVLSIVRRFR